MGYFSNMTEAEMWQVDNCNKCAHWKDGCPVDDAHMLFNYDLCNAKDNPGKVILDLLIPRKDGWNAKCAMFIRRTKQSNYEARQLAKYNESMGIKPSTHVKASIAPMSLNRRENCDE